MNHLQLALALAPPQAARQLAAATAAAAEALHSNPNLNYRCSTTPSLLAALRHLAVLHLGRGRGHDGPFRLRLAHLARAPLALPLAWPSVQATIQAMVPQLALAQHRAPSAGVLVLAQLLPGQRLPRPAQLFRRA